MRIMRIISFLLLTAIALLPSAVFAVGDEAETETTEREVYRIEKDTETGALIQVPTGEIESDREVFPIIAEQASTEDVSQDPVLSQNSAEVARATLDQSIEKRFLVLEFWVVVLTIAVTILFFLNLIQFWQKRR